MPYTGTGVDIWYRIEPTDDPDALWIQYSSDMPDCWMEEIVAQVTKRIGPHHYDPPMAGVEPNTIDTIARMSTN